MSSIRLLALLLLAAAPATAQDLFPNFNYEAVCTAPQLRKDHVVIDANTGDNDGKTQFAEQTTVQVVYYKPNPFRYSYAFSHNFLSFDTAQTFDFFKLVPGMGGALNQLLNVGASAAPRDDQCASVLAVASGKAKVDGRTVTMTADTFGAVKAGDTIIVGTNAPIAIERVDSARQLTLVSPVPGGVQESADFEVQRKADTDAAFAKTINARLAALKKRLDTERAGAAAANKKTQDVLPTYEIRQREVFKAQSLDCKAMLPELNKLLFRLHELLPLNVDAHVTTLEAILTDARQVQTEVAGHAFVSESCSQQVKTNVANLLSVGDGSVEKTLEHQKIVRTGLKAMQASYDTLRERFTASNLFYAQDQITQPRAGFENITIKVTPLDQNDKDEPPKPRNVRLQFGEGESRIRLSAGIGFSSATDARIIRVAGKQGETDITRFGFETDSSFRPSALIMISVLPWDVSRKGQRVATWGPSVGLVLSNRGDGAVTEYLGGVTFGLAGDLAFLTLGFHAARPEGFPSGYKENDIVPANMGDPLPVRRDWEAAGMLALSFKIR